MIRHPKRRKSRPDSPPPDVPPSPVGPALLWIGVAIFMLLMAAGLVRSFTRRHWLPRVGVEYTTELNQIVQERGNVAALPQIRSAARIDFDNEIALTRLLETARAVGDGNSAVWALVALVRLKPEDGRIRDELVSALLRQGRVVEAYSQGEFAVRLNPDSSEAHFHLGAVFAALGQEQHAAAAYRRALDLDPSSKTARLALESLLRGF